MYYFILLVLGLFPRLFVLFLKVLTDWFQPVFVGWLWIILGIIFAPVTLLWYSVVINWFYGQWGTWQIVVLVFAIIVDLFSLSRFSRISEE
jgi:hypothetical protein